MAENRLTYLVADFIENTPAVIVQEVITALQDHKASPTENLKIKLLNLARNPHTKYSLNQLLDCWISENSTVSAESICLCLQSSLQTKAKTPAHQLELIWTGPIPGSVARNFRRTDQVLLELINGAKEHLVVVSFAVYKAQNIIEAVENAIRRNVKVDLFLEDVDDSKGKISFSGINSFSSKVFRLASIYTWPIEARPKTIDGRFGSLHAKVAVADGKKVFISSANLTEYAMELNIEIGVMIEDALIGQQINDLFSGLVREQKLNKMI